MNLDDLMGDIQRLVAMHEGMHLKATMEQLQRWGEEAERLKVKAGHGRWTSVKCILNRLLGYRDKKGRGVERLMAIARDPRAKKCRNPFQYWLSALSQAGDLIADPFAGAGTTGFAAKTIGGRRFIGTDPGHSENGTPWAEIANARISEAVEASWSRERAE